MFSTDKNIESIADLVEAAKKYIGLKSEYIKLDVIDKVVRIITALALTVVILLLVILLLIYLSFAAAYALADLTGSLPLGFLTVAGIYLLLLLVIIFKRKAWIEKPLVSFLAGILLE